MTTSRSSIVQSTYLCLLSSSSYGPQPQCIEDLLKDDLGGLLLVKGQNNQANPVLLLALEAYHW